MRIWVVAAVCYWLLAIVCYIAKKQARTAMAFFDGLLLAFLCFALLPEAFLESGFWLGVCGLLIGVLMGPLLELNRFVQSILQKPFCHSVAFSVAVVLLFIKEGVTVFVMAVVGGFLLSFACAATLPEQGTIRYKAAIGVMSATGFLIGTWCLYTV